MGNFCSGEILICQTLRKVAYYLDFDKFWQFEKVETLFQLICKIS